NFFQSLHIEIKMVWSLTTFTVVSVVLFIFIWRITMKNKLWLIYLVSNLLLLNKVYAEEEIGVQEKIKKAYELYLQDQSVTLSKKSWRMGFDASYISNEKTVLFTQQENRLIQSGISVNYGLTDRIELFGRVPIVYENYTFRDIFSEEKQNLSSANLGNITLGANVTLFRVKNGPTITWQTAFLTPTYTGKFLTSKSAVSTGMTIYQDFDPAFLYSGLSGTKTIDGNQFDSFGYHAGFGFSLNHRLALGTEISGGYNFGQQMFFANREFAQLTGRATFVLSQKNLIQPSVSFGLNENTPDFSLSMQ
ncbi:MAG: hypothetical protein Q7T50_02155, partial [Candidatus Magasanikbacteria bacterium]|nr:hypothetical protein [Candidatus Magasanikbacteria bacterium]